MHEREAETQAQDKTQTETEAEADIGVEGEIEADTGVKDRGPSSEDRARDPRPKTRDPRADDPDRVRAQQLKCTVIGLKVVHVVQTTLGPNFGLKGAALVGRFGLKETLV